MTSCAIATRDTLNGSLAPISGRHTLVSFERKYPETKGFKRRRKPPVVGGLRARLSGRPYRIPTEPVQQPYRFRRPPLNVIPGLAEWVRANWGVELSALAEAET